MAKTAKSGSKKQSPSAAGKKNGSKAAEVSAEKPAAQAAAAAAAAVHPQPGQAPGAAPSMRILGQYLKDLSFESPGAPASLAPQQSQPEINISVNVNARNLAPTDFEVELQLEAKATQQDKVVFAVEMLYAGVFRLENIPEQALHPVVLVECPRIIFPFARQILADATRSGGFPPLMLDPIDFAGMYQRRLAEQGATRQTA